MRTFYRALRILSVITLFFFCWTFLPLYSVAAWAADKGRKASPNLESSSGQAGERSEGVKNVHSRQTSGERFEKALEDIREKVERAEKKEARGEDDAEERRVIREKKAEIEALDAELRKEFAGTEKKLKDAGLPKDLLDRHYKFVRHYEDNLRELKANLDGVEKAKTKSERKSRLRKAKAHLEKTKLPKKHVPLDPNNLPFQSRKAKAPKAPRLKKEEFERDFGPQKKANTLASLHAVSAADEHGWSQILNSALQQYTSP